MEKRARVTSKGQVTIPLEIRRLLGVKTGDDLIFESDGNAVSVRPLRTESPFEKHRGIDRQGRGLSREEVVRQIRQLRGE